MSEVIELKLKDKDELIEIFPYGVTMSLDGSRPVMIFKDKSEKYILPVWLNQIEANIAINQGQLGDGQKSPHEAALCIFKSLNIEIDSCVFDEIRGQHQYLKINYVQDELKKQLQFRAEDILSFCLESQCQFFCTINHMNNSRKINVEIENTKSKLAFENQNNIMAPRGVYLN